MVTYHKGMVGNRRRCARCLKLKSLDKFKPRADGSLAYCYACELEYFKTYNAQRYASAEARQAELDRGRDKYQSVIKPARMKRKIQLIMLMGGKCERCGYDKSAAALDFDHIDPATKQRTISHLLAATDPEAWALAVEEAKKCRLLCSNCHRERTYPGHELKPVADKPLVVLSPASWQDGQYTPMQIAF